MRGIKALRWAACGLLFISVIFFGIIAFQAMCFERMYMEAENSVPWYRWLSISVMALPLVLLAVGIACTLIGTYKRGLKWQITSWGTLVLTAVMYLMPIHKYGTAFYILCAKMVWVVPFLDYTLPFFQLFRLLFLAGIMLILISVIWAGIKRSRQTSASPPMVL